MLAELILSCAPALDPRLAIALIKRESGFNQFAIGLDSKHNVRLSRQPRTAQEAALTAADLAQKGYSFSVGLTQIHITNVKKWGISWNDAFVPCTSLKISQSIFLSFFKVAQDAGYKGDDAVYAALRGYNSGSISAQVSNNYASAIMAGAKGFQGQVPGLKNPISNVSYPAPTQLTAAQNATTRNLEDATDSAERAEMQENR
jgi:type IV secretion system protein VirB1